MGRALENVTLNMLMAEDSKGDALSFRRALSRVSPSTLLTVVDSAEAALALFTYGSARTFDLCLFDINLPQLSGLDLLQRVKLWQPSLPMLIMSSSDAEHDIRRAFAGGADGYVIKPFDFRDYDTIIRCIHEGWAEGTSLVGRHPRILLPGNDRPDDRDDLKRA